jgi:cytochrome c peroxidase
MRNYFSFITLVVVITGISSATVYYSKAKEGVIAKVKSQVELELDSLNHIIGHQLKAAIVNDSGQQLIQHYFFAARKKYKNIEFAIEYFHPYIARTINGPALPEIEAEEHIVIEPGGLQVLETYFFPNYDSSKKQAAISDLKKLTTSVQSVKNLWSALSIRDDQVFDAIRQEFVRIITMGITGFDTPVCMQSINEIPATLASVKKVLGWYTSKNNIKHNVILHKIESAIAFIAASDNFNSFNRINFITEYINPITKELMLFQKECKVAVLDKVYALNGSMLTLFDSNAIRTEYFIPSAHSNTTPQKVALGKSLFYDKILSGNNQISCASCHQPQKAFTDGLTKGRALAGAGFLQRNTPTVINAALQTAQFYDHRANYLEDQVTSVVENKDEIHGSMKANALKLYNNEKYKQSFINIFPEAASGIQERHIQIVLAAYIRSLTSFNARFDKYMRGNFSLLSSDEQQGFNLFMGKAKCGTCHFMPIFNGTVPPSFTHTESEVLGVPKTSSEKELDDDPGRYNIHEIAPFKNAFKTPTLRNIALTAPYMHNGVYKTLEQVVDFYNKGGGAGLGFEVINQTLPKDKLELSLKEKQQLVSFLHTLTDSSSLLK